MSASNKPLLAAPCRWSRCTGSSRRTRSAWAASTGPAAPCCSPSRPGTTPQTGTWPSSRVLLSTFLTRSMPGSLEAKRSSSASWIPRGGDMQTATSGLTLRL